MKLLTLLSWVWLPAIANLSPTAASESSAAQSKPLDYMILVTGGELLEGVYADAHTPFLTRTLRVLGCRCAGSLIVDDNRADIQRALRFATNQAPLVIVTGGLGPTPNDITRETLSDFTGIPLREHPEAVGELERRFHQSRDQLRANLRRQAQVPTRGGYLPNTNGSAVGLVFDSGSSVILALPGPPRELQAMTTNELVPFLRRRFGVRALGCSVTLRFVGIGQSLIDETIKEHLTIAPDVIITSLFEGSRVDFTFALPGHAPEDRQRLQRLARELRRHLNEYVYADDGSSLEEVVLKQLQARGASLVLAEVASGGHLAAALSGVDGAADLIRGALAAPTLLAMARLLRVPPESLSQTGPEAAQALASAAAEQTQSQWAIAIGPVESDEQGRTSAWLAVLSPGEHGETLRLALRGSWETTHSNLTTQILDFLRRRLR